ncbi:MAG: metallophosphoesterase [Gammaproteobacteria bacterium]|nr:metallophosphoesterase [Gammaproteobacteria bacterium]
MEPLRILQLSDIHMLPGEGSTKYGLDPADCLLQNFACVNRLEKKPDVVIVTGDMAEDGSEETYSRLKQMLLQFDCPVYVLPGNHDHVSNLRKALLCDRIIMESLIDLKSWRLITVNSQVEGEVYGAIEKEGLFMLEKLISEGGDTPCLVALHHNPVPVCDSPGCQLLGNEEFLNMLSRNSQVRAVISGHTHYSGETDCNQIRLLATASTFVQINHKTAKELDYEKNPGQVHSLDRQQRGCRVLDLHEDGRIDTAVLVPETREI